MRARLDTGAPYTNGLDAQTVALVKAKSHLRKSWISIVGIGDSFTVRGNAYRTSVNNDLLAIYGSSMRIEWSGDFTDSTNVDDPPVIPTQLSQARTGTTSANILSTTPTDFSATTHAGADVIVNMFGINDAIASVSNSTFQANLLSILESEISHAPNAQIVVAHVQPRPCAPSIDATVATYNASIGTTWAQVETDTGRTLFKTSGPPSMVCGTDYEADGLHPNPTSGNPKIAATLTGPIQSAIIATHKSVN